MGKKQKKGKKNGKSRKKKNIRVKKVELFKNRGKKSNEKVMGIFTTMAMDRGAVADEGRRGQPRFLC